MVITGKLAAANGFVSRAVSRALMAESACNEPFVYIEHARHLARIGCGQTYPVSTNNACDKPAPPHLDSEQLAKAAPAQTKRAVKNLTRVTDSLNILEAMLANQVIHRGAVSHVDQGDRRTVSLNL